MENNSAIYKIAQAPPSAFNVENVITKFNTGVPTAFSFGAQVSIFVIAVLLAITFIQFLLNRD